MVYFRHYVFSFAFVSENEMKKKKKGFKENQKMIIIKHGEKEL